MPHDGSRIPDRCRGGIGELVAAAGHPRVGIHAIHEEGQPSATSCRKVRIGLHHFGASPVINRPRDLITYRHWKAPEWFAGKFELQNKLRGRWEVPGSEEGEGVGPGCGKGGALCSYSIDWGCRVGLRPTWLGNSG